MTFVVTSSCHGCRYTDCVAVCPVDCFHGDEHMLYIDPDACIDCGACLPVCPVEAIYDEGSLPDDEQRWLSVNAERSRALPVINRRAEPLSTAAARAAAFGFRAARRG